MRTTTTRSILIAVLSISAASFAYSQAVDERNVRAGMTFLAGDAMQGRGSGTQFERIAAEYVGSQFMQFGLEAAGDTGFDGKPGFTQTAGISRATFGGPPTLRYGSTALFHGREMIVLRTNVGMAGGLLHKVTGTDTRVNPGSVVLIRTTAADDPRALQQSMQRYLTDGASMVIVEETPQWRATWPTLATRRLGYTASSTPVKPSITVVVSSAAAEELSKVPNGTRIDFAGPLLPIQASQTWNAIGKITGSDLKLSADVVVLSSHLDHLGVRENAQGDDKLFNGADDDASGTVAVMELARVLASGKKPKRTVYFVCYGSEEAGGIGSGHFVNTLPFPKEKIVANLQWEMIGRPDAKVKSEELWLTGYERSNLGPELAKRGAKLVQDPHPTENFFQRSDNFTLARQGVIAHTVSSFGLHTDYHKASDELKTIDFGHMTKSINSMINPIEWLLNSDFRPAWVEGSAHSMKALALLFAAAFFSVCDRPPIREADHSKHDHTQVNHGVMDHSKMESSPGAAESPQALQFIDTMIAHHQGAVDMAQLANTRTQRDEISKLATSIIDEQRREIADMQTWRKKWFGEAKPALNIDFPGMKTGMAGMDMVKLAGLKSNEFNAEFIRQMIPHHEGAIQMAEALKKDDKYTELGALADSIITSQSAEIEQMKKWLEAWSATHK